MEEQDIKLNSLLKFYNLFMKGQSKLTRVEMTDFLIKNSNLDITEIPEKITLLRKIYKSEYYIYECNRWGLTESLGIRRIKKIIKMKLG
jgi:hypothetical protein